MADSGPAAVLGRDIRMDDAEQRVVGTVPFTLDVDVPGMVHAHVVRSPFPHARIGSIDAAEALASPGVLAVLTGADLVADPGVDPWFGAMRADQPVLAPDRARYAGDPVAIVIAETARGAAEAALLVDVDYDPLPYVADHLAAGEDGAPAVHDAWPDNACGSWRLRHGDLEAGLAAADVVHTGVYTSPSASHVPMEPHVAVASWDDGLLTVWSSTQAPHAVATAMRSMFDLAEDGVRIRTRNLGGGYGAKGQIKLEPLVACAARAVGRPVRLELTRDEVYLTIAKHAATVTITTGATADGVLTARKVDIVYDAGAYAVTTPGAVGQGLTRAPGPYRLPACHIDAVGRYTNRVPTGPFRGAMTSQLAFAYETQLDDIAAELGIDPVEIRRRNLLRDGDEYATGEALHDLHFDQLLTDVVAGVEVGQPSAPTSPHLARGKGVAVIIKNTLTPSRSEARLEACADGRLLLHSSTVEMGQGGTTTMRQIAAHHLGVAPERIEVGFPDTAITPFDTVTASSRSTSSMGVAVERAAAALRAALAAAGADRLGVPVGAVDHVDGAVVVSADRSRCATYADLAAGAGGSIEAEGVFATDFGLRFMDPHDVRGPVSAHWHQGAASAEVEVDLETGHVEVDRPPRQLLRRAHRQPAARPPAEPGWLGLGTRPDAVRGADLPRRQRQQPQLQRVPGPVDRGRPGAADQRRGRVHRPGRRAARRRRDGRPGRGAGDRERDPRRDGGDDHRAPGDPGTGAASARPAPRGPDVSDPTEITLALDGGTETRSVRSDETLLETLREQVGVTSVRGSCGVGMCGTCTVLLDGRAVSSCLTLSALAADRPITTSAGLLGADGSLSRVQQAFVDRGAYQCSFCIPGMVLTVHAAITDDPDIDLEGVRDALAGNLCRCGTYPQVLEAVVELLTTDAERRDDRLRRQDHHVTDARCIDIHAHFVPPSLVDDLRSGSALDGMTLEDRDGSPWVVHRQGPKYPLQPELHDLDARLAMMDRLGIDLAIVSVSPTLLFYWLESSEAIDWARKANDDIAALVAASGGRIRGVGHLPMQDPDAAIAEARRVRDELGFVGVQMAPMILDRTLDEDDHETVLAELERLGLPIMLHPYFVGAGDRPGFGKYFLTNLSGHPYATAVGASRLIMSGLLDRLPDLKPVLVHGGGYLPYQVGRLDHGHDVRPEAKACQEVPSSYLRRFHFDTLTHSARSLAFLADLVGTDRIAYGTDFPYDMGGGSADDQLAGVGLDEQATAAVQRDNALALFGLE